MSVGEVSPYRDASQLPISEGRRALNLSVLLGEKCKQVVESHNKGTLQTNVDGLVYVRVHEIFDEMYLTVSAWDFKRPPFFKPITGVKSHIAVVSLREKPGMDHGLFLKTEEVTFSYKGVQFIKVKNWKGVAEVAVIQVACERLSEYRQQRGLSPLLDGRRFCITIGVKFYTHPKPPVPFARTRDLPPPFDRISDPYGDLNPASGEMCKISHWTHDVAEAAQERYTEADEKHAEELS